MQEIAEKYYTKTEVLHEINEWFGVDSYEKVMEEIENGTRRADFGNYTQVPIIQENRFGVITLRQFFEEFDNGGETLHIKQLKEFLRHDKWKVERHDNTYNYSGCCERDMDYQVIVGEEDEQAIVFYSVHVGLDARSGYKKSFAVLYDTLYDFFDHIGQSGGVGYAEFKRDGKKFNISVDGEIQNDNLRTWISDEENNCIDVEYCEETTDIDTYDKEEFIKTVAEYLEDNGISYDEGTLMVVD